MVFCSSSLRFNWATSASKAATRCSSRTDAMRCSNFLTTPAPIAVRGWCAYNPAHLLTRPSLAAGSHDVDRRGLDGLSPASAPESGAGALAAERAEAAVGCLVLWTYEDGLHCNVVPIRAGCGAGG